MIKLRYNIWTNWPFYLLVLGYVYLVFNMTYALWFGDGVNIFASYSEPTTSAAILLDANKVYWSKTSFLFLTLFLYSFGLDYRFVAGVGATFWASSLIIMFGPTGTLLFTLVIGIILIGQQLWFNQVFQPQHAESAYQLS